MPAEPYSRPYPDPDQDPDARFDPRPEPDPSPNTYRQPDPMSIGSGVVFFLIGGAYLLATGGHLSVNAGWTISLLVLGLGLSGVVSAVLRARRRGGRE